MKVVGGVTENHLKQGIQCFPNPIQVIIFPRVCQPGMFIAVQSSNNKVERIECLVVAMAVKQCYIGGTVGSQAVQSVWWPCSISYAHKYI